MCCSGRSIVLRLRYKARSFNHVKAYNVFGTLKFKASYTLGLYTFYKWLALKVKIEHYFVYNAIMGLNKKK
ncbi:hypothetical protein TOL5_18080 [Acinetobacter sp. Tol 5]|nr:hypothetical protein TOL5_18080 [Acinetobacter sp. Tol 5]